MTMVIETGSGVTGANSYCTMTFTSAYFVDIGKSSEWTTLATGQESALIRSCYYMENLDWLGLKALSTQPLEWPRRGVTDKNGYYVSATGIPLQIKWVQSELAIRFLNGDDPLPDQDATGNIIREKVDVIEIQYESGGAQQMPYQPYIDTLLKDWTKNRGIVEIFRA
jgi:hypothetical protein